MSWLKYTDDEITSFHPEFESVAREALVRGGLQSEYEWIHHPPRTRSDIFPDFVLSNKTSGEWVLIVEIKRRIESVYSTRNQFQVKDYAERYSSRYPLNRPKFFCLSNLETSILFALRDALPPLECQLENGVYESGLFKEKLKEEHRTVFIDHLITICERVIRTRDVTYERIWPSVLEHLNTHIRAIPTTNSITYKVPTTPNWSVVQSFFGEPNEVNAARLFLLRCFMAEYLRGTLNRVGHPKAKEVPPLRSNPSARIPSSVANTIDKLRLIDFIKLFESSSSDIYRKLTDATLLSILESYIKDLISTQVANLAKDRIDALELIDSLFSNLYPLESLPLGGKVQTDSELAYLLAVLTINKAVSNVYDPGCGTGALLSAAYDRLVDLGMTGQQALESISGIEADEISTHMAALRLALKKGKTLTPSLRIKIDVGDIFWNPILVQQADIILMNPPFKRYESQDSKPIPPELREHYNQAIQLVDSSPPTTTKGQPNLYNYYIEYITKNTKPSARLGIILDNKWYHSQYGKYLRKLVLDNYEIEALIEYPHNLYFKAYTIATSLLILNKPLTSNPSNVVRFVRCDTDPLLVGTEKIAESMHNKMPWPPDWHENCVPQKELDYKTGWKIHFHTPFGEKYLHLLKPLGDLYLFARRGSLNKEGGGTGVIDFPFNQVNYGPKRLPYSGNSQRRPWQTCVGKALTKTENIGISALADNIPIEYRGWSIRNADDLNHYILTEEDVTKVQTIEPPKLRGNPIFYRNKRSNWTKEHDEALSDIKNNPLIAPFISELETTIGLNESTLTRKELWVCLREPYGGELIIPRKMRIGHRVHINPYAFTSESRQVRISSNFISFKNCLAIDQSSGLNKLTACKLVAAFLISSFGQIQFERTGYNREGVLSIEENQLKSLRVMDPRDIRVSKRQAIIQAFEDLPFPISNENLSPSQPERNHLDILIAEEICTAFNLPSVTSLIEEVHSSLDEWLEARQP